MKLVVLSGVISVFVVLAGTPLLIRLLGIIHQHLHQKPVQLRLRQRIRPLLLNRILRRQRHERRRQWQGLSVNRHLRLLHHF